MTRTMNHLAGLLNSPYCQLEMYWKRTYCEDDRDDKVQDCSDDVDRFVRDIS